MSTKHGEKLIHKAQQQLVKWAKYVVEHEANVHFASLNPNKKQRDKQVAKEMQKFEQRRTIFFEHFLDNYLLQAYALRPEPTSLKKMDKQLETLVHSLLNHNDFRDSDPILSARPDLVLDMIEQVQLASHG